jgi:hypothetical protein
LPKPKQKFWVKKVVPRAEFLSCFSKRIPLQPANDVIGISWSKVNI